MKRILITGAGGAPGTNFVRSLRLVTHEQFYLIGIDADPFYLQRAETDEKHLAPRFDDSQYLQIVNQIIEETGAELIFAQPDVEIGVLSEMREKLGCRTFLPAKETIRVCLDKYASFERWKKAGLTVPETMMIRTEADLREAFERFGPRIWIRAIRGAFGKGSLPTESYEQAKAWLDFQKGWGAFSAAECLEEQSVTWQSIWRNGELVVAQGRKRLYWEFANRSPSGVTGLTGTGVTIRDPQLDDLAHKAIMAIDRKPHGIFSVDMTYDKREVPNPTEINIGRFFTTHLFFSTAGLNMPYLYVKLAFDEEVPQIEPKINPLPEGLAWIRGMDIEPVLSDVKIISAAKQELMKRRVHLGGLSMRLSEHTANDKR
jgi:hypothetical protein